jgi:4-amino-4-deoxy-L-arabinose transferase-like glycosyltransferase
MPTDHRAATAASGGPPAPRATASAVSPHALVRIALGLIILTGAGVRFWGIGFGLPYTQARPDETQVMDVALHCLRGDFWPPFFDYPRLYSYLLVVCYLAYFAVGWVAGLFAGYADFVASWPIEWVPFFLINRSLSALAGTATILVLYGMGRMIGGRRTALVAALFMALVYSHVRDAHFGTTDMMLILLSTASVFWLMKCDLLAWGRHDVAAALLAGLAAATKYNAVILAVPLAISQVFRAARRSGPWLAGLLDSRALVIVAAFGLAFFVGVPFVLFDWHRFWLAMQDMVGLLKVGQTPRMALPNGWWYHLSVSLRYGLGIPLLACGLVGIAILGLRDWRRALLLFSFPVTYYLVAGLTRQLFVRYVLLVVPFLCLGGAVTVVAIANRFVSGPRWRAVLTAVLALAVVGPPAGRVIAFDRVAAEKDNRVIAAEWIGQHAEPGASVLVSGSPYGAPQFDGRFTVWSWNRPARTFFVHGVPASGRPDWILLQESPVPSSTQTVVGNFLANGYDLVTTLRAYDPAVRENYYDPQDSFYLPFSGFERVRRPGPNFAVYKSTSTRYAPRSGSDVGR